MAAAAGTGTVPGQADEQGVFALANTGGEDDPVLRLLPDATAPGQGRGRGGEVDGNVGDGQLGPDNGAVPAAEAAAGAGGAREAAETPSTDDTAELAAFRQQWQSELQSGPAAEPEPSLQTREDAVYAEALRLQLLGEQFEEEGLLQQATTCYRMAAKMVPDIEFKAFEMRQAGQPTASSNERGRAGEAELVADLRFDTNALGPDPGLEMAVANTEEGVVFELEDGEAVTLEPRRSSKATHLGALPPELVIRVLQSVVDLDPDLRLLERCALVSRFFYLCARDKGAWRHAAARLQGGTLPLNATPAPCPSWRHHCITTPRVLYHGVYISKISYVRVGEQGLDQFYKPLHVVDYYRYIRFFTNGDACTLTTPETPVQIVPQLRDVGSSRLPLLWGTHSVAGSKVTVTVHKLTMVPPKGQHRGSDKTETTSFISTFTVGGRQTRGRALRTSVVLQWQSHRCHISRKLRGVQQEPLENAYHLNEHYRPFVFSRVNTLSLNAAGVTS